MQKSNATKVIGSGSLDKTESMQLFLKDIKMLTELSKGVQSMKHYLYPSVLQKQAITALKSSKVKNVLIRYQEMTGIKLTVLLPLFNAQIRAAAMQTVTVPENEQVEFYSIVICHSFIRCEEMAEFCNELVQFCPEMLEVLHLDSRELNDALVKLKNAKKNSRLLISTPAIIQ